MYRKGNWAYLEEGNAEANGDAAPPSPPWNSLKGLPTETATIVDGKRLSSRAQQAAEDKKRRDEQARAQRAAEEAEKRERSRIARERLAAQKRQALIAQKAKDAVDAARRKAAAAATSAPTKKPRASAPAALQIPDLGATASSTLVASPRSPTRPTTTTTTLLPTVVETEVEDGVEENVEPASIAAEGAVPMEGVKKQKIRPGDALKAIRSGGAGIAADLKLLHAGAAAKAAATASLPTPNLESSANSSFDLASNGFDLYGDDSDLSSVPPSSDSDSSSEDDAPARKKKRRVRKHGLPTPSATSGSSDSPPRKRAKTVKDVLAPKGKDRKAFLTAGLYSASFKSLEKPAGRRASAPAPGILGFTAAGAPRKPAADFLSASHEDTFPLPINYGIHVLCPAQPRDFRLPFDIYDDYVSDLQGDLEKERERLERLGKGKKPDKYERIRTNAYPFRKVEKSEIPAAVCLCQDGDCQEGCINRMMQYLCSPASCPRGGLCTNGPLHLRKDGLEESTSTTKPGLKVFFTGNRGFGLRTEVPIEKGKFVLEYRGEVISRDESYRRVLNEYRGKNSFYFLDYDGYDVLDAGMRGNCARFINHSCDPNLRVVRFKLSGLEEYQIGLYALKDIVPGTELTYDYKWENFADLAPTSDVRTHVGDDGTTDSSAEAVAPAPAAQRCLCGSENCIGLLGAKRNKKEDEKEKKKGLKGAKKSKKRKRKAAAVRAAVEKAIPVAEVAPEAVEAAVEKATEMLVDDQEDDDEEEEEDAMEE